MRGLSVCAMVAGLSTVVGCAQDDVAAEGPKVDIAGEATDAATTRTGNASGDVVTSGTIGQPTRVISTQPTKGARVTLDHELADDDQIVVKVTIRSFDNLYGIAAHLRYDAKALELVAIKGHDVLNNFSHSSRTVAKESPSGRLLLGAARFLNNSKPWSTLQGASVDSELWATLRFAVHVEGEHVVSFDPARSFAKDSKYVDVATKWGELRITRQVEAP
jgi:hypothetical protein